MNGSDLQSLMNAPLTAAASDDGPSSWSARKRGEGGGLIVGCRGEVITEMDRSGCCFVGCYLYGIFLWVQTCVSVVLLLKIIVSKWNELES